VSSPPCSRYYVLDDRGEPVAAGSVEEWARWFEANRLNRHVGDTTIDGVRVSTVFLGVDHQWGSGPPLIFETMIFGGPYDSYEWRWTTRAQASANHDQAVAAIRDGLPPLDAGAVRSE